MMLRLHADADAEEEQEDDDANADADAEVEAKGRKKEEERDKVREAFRNGFTVPMISGIMKLSVGEVEEILREGGLI